jgi:uncharacterized protein (TIGR03437 family)
VSVRIALSFIAAVGLSAAQNSTVWVPPAQVNWQWQLTSPVDITVDADIYDIDMFDNDASLVAALHAKGRKVICYVDVGSWEGWRPDAKTFPESVKGKAMDGWPDEKWLDIRRWDVLGPIMTARMSLCKQKGFDAVEPDNVDGYTNSTGFSLTAADQLSYNRHIAQAAHNLGLSVGLKNDVDQLSELVNDFDWALNEQCFRYKECSGYSAFTSAGKSVLQVEYDLPTTSFCPTANSMNLNSMLKHVSLDAYRSPCRTAASAPAITGIFNGASYSNSGVSPNEIVVVFGTNMGPVGTASAPAADWPTTLAGTRVLFGETPARLLYVTPAQISAVVPATVAGSTKVTIDRGNGVVSAAFAMLVAAAVPGLFTLNAQGTEGAAALNYVTSASTVVNGPAAPAARGSYIALFATGVSGSDVKVSIGGAAATVTYAGGVSWSGTGLVQVNAIVPAGSPSGPAVPVKIQSAGATSQDNVTLSIQ